MPDPIPHQPRSRRGRQVAGLRSVSSAEKAAPQSAVLPPGDLGRYLRVITLPGAPALNFPLWGLRRGADLYPLPVTNPSALRRCWLAGELELIPFNGARLKRKDIEQLIEMLAPGPARTDGLPYYRPDLWGWDRRRTKKGRRGGTARRLAVAVASDLGDHSLIEVGAKVLREADHELVKAGARGGPKGAHEMRRHARRYWAQLGVWPWAHAPRGKLPKSWRTQCEFLEPLQAWHERARRDVEQGLTGSTRAFSDGHSFRRSDLLKLPPEDAVRRVEPDELRQRFLQRLERGVPSAETIADAEGAAGTLGQTRSQPPELP
jgi:hypothetical protein